MPAKRASDSKIVEKGAHAGLFAGEEQVDALGREQYRAEQISRRRGLLQAGAQQCAIIEGNKAVGGDVGYASHGRSDVRMGSRLYRLPRVAVAPRDVDAAGRAAVAAAMDLTETKRIMTIDNSNETWRKNLRGDLATRTARRAPRLVVDRSAAAGLSGAPARRHADFAGAAQSCDLHAAIGARLFREHLDADRSAVLRAVRRRVLLPPALSPPAPPDGVLLLPSASALHQQAARGRADRGAAQPEFRAPVRDRRR